MRTSAGHQRLSGDSSISERTHGTDAAARKELLSVTVRTMRTAAGHQQRPLVGNDSHVLCSSSIHVRYDENIKSGFEGRSAARQPRIWTHGPAGLGPGAPRAGSAICTVVVGFAANACSPSSLQRQLCCRLRCGVSVLKEMNIYIGWVC